MFLCFSTSTVGRDAVHMNSVHITKSVIQSYTVIPRVQTEAVKMDYAFLQNHAGGTLNVALLKPVHSTTILDTILVSTIWILEILYVMTATDTPSIIRNLTKVHSYTTALTTRGITYDTNHPNVRDFEKYRKSYFFSIWVIIGSKSFKLESTLSIIQLELNFLLVHLNLFKQ